MTIKRYPNRRLYDTSSGKYVNLADIAAAVRSGADIQVVDAKTGEDLTRVILTQIIVEDAKEQPTGLPLELLRQLILASDHAGKEFLMWYLKSAFETYRKVQDTAMSPIHLMKNFFSGGPPAQTEIDQLRERIAELESRLDQPKPKRKPARKRKAAKK
jgi:polyhydroxyalkanoate synthesis repressor PhaR